MTQQDQEQTFNDRLELTKQVVFSDVVSTVESLKYLYNHLRFELALVRRERARAQCNKYVSRLNTDRDVYAMREKLAKMQ